MPYVQRSVTVHVLVFAFHKVAATMYGDNYLIILYHYMNSMSTLFARGSAARNPRRGIRGAESSKYPFQDVLKLSVYDKTVHRK